MRKLPGYKLAASTLVTLVFYFSTSSFFGFSLISKQESIVSKTTAFTGANTASPEIYQQAVHNTPNISSITASYFQDIHFPLIPFSPSQQAVTYYENSPPELLALATEVYNGDSNTVRGVYIENVIALPVIQQPAGEVGFVSDNSGEITEFQSARKNNVIGLLAHNYLSGSLFYQISPGDIVFVIFGNGTIRRYQVEGHYYFERLDRSNLRSHFVDLSNGATLTSDMVFDRFYKGNHQLTFQTCLARNGISNWGLQFTHALPIDDRPAVPLP
jgi:hypothetical protein